MTLGKGQTYSDKHGKNVKIEENIASQIRSRAKNKELPCAVAFDIARDLGCGVEKVGQTTDLLNFRLIKCQLGLFGYKPEKKIVKSELPSDPRIEKALKSGAVSGAIACKEVWELAARFEISKMAVSAGCEALGIKVKPCQLGAF